MRISDVVIMGDGEPGTLYISIRIAAPLYWWIQFGIDYVWLINIADEPFNASRFQVPELNKGNCLGSPFYKEHHTYWKNYSVIVSNLNNLREKFLKTKDYRYLNMIKEMLPMSYIHETEVWLTKEQLMIKYRESLNQCGRSMEWNIFKEFVEENIELKRYQMEG